jgi:hypothetical protein
MIVVPMKAAINIVIGATNSVTEFISDHGTWRLAAWLASSTA